jgi:hypothetical protein
VLLMAVASLIPAGVAVARTLSLSSAADRSAVAGCLVVFAEENRIGPYRTAVSGSDGTVDVPDSFAGTLLLIHSRYVPAEAPASGDRIVLTPGTGVTAPPPGSSIRIYQRSWIGRFDVETLPPLPVAEPLFCNSPDTVFDVQRAGKARAIAQGRVPVLDSGNTTQLNIRVGVRGDEKPSGFVYLADASDPAKESPDPPRSRAIPADGHLVFEDVSSSPRLIVAAVDGFAPTVIPIRMPSPAPTLIEPRRGLDAIGMIECRPPVDGFAVHAELRLRQLPDFPIARAVTTAASAFTVTGLAPGQMTVAASAPDHRDDVRRVVISEERRQVDVGSLCPGQPFLIRGVIQGGTRPLPDARVTYGRQNAKSDARGRFVLRAVAPVAGQLQVVHVGFLPWKRWYEAGAGTPLQITLQRGVRLRGTVVDEKTRKPVSSFQLAVLGGDSPGKLFKAHFASPSGTFATSAIDPHAAALMIEASGYEPQTVDLPREAPAESAGDHDLGLLSISPAPAIAGRVLDDRNEPVESAVVRLVNAELPDWDPGLAGYTAFETTSAADGRFRLPARQQRFTLEVRAAGFAPLVHENVVPSEAADVGDLVLTRGCVLKGTILARGGGAAGLLVELHRGNADSKSDVSSTTSDGAGGFTFSDVGQGPHTILVRRKKRRLAEQEVMIGKCEQLDPLQITVGSSRVVGFATKQGQAVTNTTLTLLPASEAVSPRLTVIRRHSDDSGKEVTDEILGRGASVILTQTDDAGYFEFDDVNPGPYQITMSIGDGTLARWITVPDADVTQVSVDFGRHTITGTVVDGGTQAPIPDAVLTMNSDLARTDSLGRFELDVGDAASATLSIAADGYEKKLVPVDPTTTTVLIQLDHASIRLTGVVAPSTTAAEGTVRWLLAASPAQRSGAAPLREDGSFDIDHLSPGRLTLAVYSPGYGIAVEALTLTLSDPSPSVTVPLAQPAMLRVRLPQSARPDALVFLKDGIDITRLLWSFPGFAPTLAGESEWLWTFLGPGAFDVIFGNRREAVNLMPGRPSVVGFDQ